MTQRSPRSPVLPWLSLRESAAPDETRGRRGSTGRAAGGEGGRRWRFRARGKSPRHPRIHVRRPHRRRDRHLVHASRVLARGDALIVAAAANLNGLIGGSGRIGQKRQIAVLMDSLAPHYGDDFWFMSYHAMALSEDGQLAAARPKIEQSLALNPNNAHGAHGLAHICYESGDPDTARNFLSSWLATYPRDGFFYGHVSWASFLCELQAGDGAEALRLFRDALTLDRHSGGPQQKVSDGAAFFAAFRTRRAFPRYRGLAQFVRIREERAAGAGQRSCLICTSSWPRLSWETHAALDARSTPDGNAGLRGTLSVRPLSSSTGPRLHGL